ncbi:MAG: AmiS/UreI family transporter [Tepidanaerobacteraceae bacterium]|jgi:hypothetical protein|nr:AmiS/UreI family transporter [Tepidanaerobacteraceae bacterium]
MAPAVLLIAGLIFMVDASFMLGKVEGKGVGIANAVIGIAMAIYAILLGYTAKAPGELIVAGLAITFSIFYIVLAWNIFLGADFNSLGWICLGAGIFVGLSSYFFFNAGDVRFGIFAASWSVLFFAASGNMLLQKNWGKPIGILMWFQSVITLLVPAFLMMAGKW